MGGRIFSPVVGALANATSTRHPSCGWVNVVSVEVPSETLFLGYAQNAQRRLLIIYINRIEMYQMSISQTKTRPQLGEWLSGFEPLQASAASPATPQIIWCQSAALRFGGSTTCGAFRRDEMRCPALRLSVLSISMEPLHWIFLSKGPHHKGRLGHWPIGLRSSSAVRVPRLGALCWISLEQVRRRQPNASIPRNRPFTRAFIRLLHQPWAPILADSDSHI